MSRLVVISPEVEVCYLPCSAEEAAANAERIDRGLRRILDEAVPGWDAVGADAPHGGAVLQDGRVAL